MGVSADQHCKLLSGVALSREPVEHQVPIPPQQGWFARRCSGHIALAMFPRVGQTKPSPMINRDADEKYRYAGATGLIMNDHPAEPR